MTVAACFPIPLSELISHFIFLCTATWRLHGKTLNGEGAIWVQIKMILLWDFATAVVGM